MVTRVSTEPEHPRVPESLRLILKSGITYSGTNLIAQAATFVSGLVLRRILPPELMGVWNLVIVVRDYAQGISLGTLSGALRELSILRGRSDASEEVRARSVALRYALAEATVVALGLWAYGAWRGPVLGLPTFALIGTGVLLVLGKIRGTYIVFFQGAQLYVLLSRVLVVSSLAYAIALRRARCSAGCRGSSWPLSSRSSAADYGACSSAAALA